MKYIFIVNPIAGNNNKAKIFSGIKSAFQKMNDEMIIEETRGNGDAKELAKKYSEQYKSECVIVTCGGDGTVHEVANGLAYTQTPMMILPFGTGNDFAKKIYDTRKVDLEAVISKFGLFCGDIKYDVKDIDLIDYNGEICINVMSFGVDTLVAFIGRKIADKVPFLGHQAYNLAILPVFMKPLHYNISYDITGIDKKTGEEYQLREVNKDYALFAICNASYYGGGFCPAPNSKLDDGILDFALVDGLSKAKAIPMIPKYFAGTASEETCGEVFHTGYIKSGRIWSEDGSPLYGNCDGEMFDYKEVKFEIKEKALKLCVLK